MTDFETVKCRKCKKDLTDPCQVYEYRGAISCWDCFEEVIASRERERREIIAEEDAKDWSFNEFDLDPNSAVGRENRKIFKRQMEIARKTLLRRKLYEEN